MAAELSEAPEYKHTMEQLELQKRSKDGHDYWMAREIHALFGYPTWREFEHVIDRAKKAFVGNGVDPSHQIVLTHKLMEVGRGARIQSVDYFLSRPACYLIAINGEPTKPEIAAAQAYFVIRTRESELREKDERRLELREKVGMAFRNVSGVAHRAGLPNRLQGVFHDQRYVGLYGMSARDAKRKKGLSDADNLFDRAGPLELSANEFQMNLAADVIKREAISGEQQVIQKNLAVAKRVRRTMEESRATLPEDLPLETESIAVVKKRIAKQTKLPPKD